MGCDDFTPTGVQIAHESEEKRRGNHCRRQGAEESARLRAQVLGEAVTDDARSHAAASAGANPIGDRLEADCKKEDRRRNAGPRVGGRRKRGLF